MFRAMPDNAEFKFGCSHAPTHTHRKMTVQIPPLARTIDATHNTLEDDDCITYILAISMKEKGETGTGPTASLRLLQSFLTIRVAFTLQEWLIRAHSACRGGSFLNRRPAYNPNQRIRRLDPKDCLSLARAAEGPSKSPVGAGPERKSTSTRPTLPPPNST